MQATLEDFFKALRGSDLDVSLNAQIDAARATALVGWGERELLKAALGTTLAKTLPDLAVFDETFDRFFHFDSFGTTAASAGAPAVDASQPQAPPRESSGQGSGGPGGCHDRRAGLVPVADVRRLGGTVAPHAAGRARGRPDRHLVLHAEGPLHAEDPAGHGPGTAGPRDQRGAPPDPGAAAPRRPGAGAQAALQQVHNFVERKLAMYGAAPTRELHDEFLQSQKLSTIDRRDFTRMHEIVRKIARRLAERHACRKRREQRGQLDFRRTMRANAAYGGVMFETHWRSTRIERPKVVAICDVSGSVRQYARFLLLFLYSLDELLSDVQSYAFTNHLVDVSATFESLPVEQAVDRVMQAVGGSGTDYGQMLLDLDEQLMHRIDHRTTVLVLGDARNNRGHPRSEIMKTLYGRARRVIWLNPEPRSFWGLGDSEMKRYAPYCHIARECNSLRHLERTLDELLRSNSASA